MRLLRCISLGLAVAWSATAQTYTISTYAGGLPFNIPGTSIYLSAVNAVAVDGAGIVARVESWVRQFTATGPPNGPG